MSTKIKTYHGRGKLIRDNKIVCSGFYTLTRMSSTEKLTEIHGTFIVSVVPPKELEGLLNILSNPPRYWTLEIQDGRRFDVIDMPDSYLTLEILDGRQFEVNNMPSPFLTLHPNLNERNIKFMPGQPEL